MRYEIAADVGQRHYDAVIVGAGVAGSIMAKALAERGRSVLVLEGGVGRALDVDGYRENVETYLGAGIKVPNAPYPFNANAPQPDVLDVPRLPSGNPDESRYLIQTGPNPYRSDYVRAAGGTTLHWLGTCLRMLPEDFDTKTRFDVGRDWPIGFDDLRPYYERAEREIGVSANSDDQVELGRLLGVDDGWFGSDYVYPMRRIPPSSVDRFMAEGTSNLTIDYDGRRYPLRVTSTPQGRNGIPHPDYPGGYRPVGAVGSPETGQRCQGNSSCVPICPVQAKYNGMKSLDAAVNSGHVDVITQAVASAIDVDAGGRVTAVQYKAYPDPDSPRFQTYTAHGSVFVLAAHVVENVKLLLASGLGGDATGRYLMDHPVMLTWGLADRPLGTFRGPSSTSGFESVRGGAFRRRRAPFRIEIDNWGWNWATGAPQRDVEELVFDDGRFGRELRSALFDRVQRQVRLGFLLEVPPQADNRITIDRGHLDALGNPRPVIAYEIPDYTKAGMAEAKATSNTIFGQLGIADRTVYAPDDRGHVSFEGRDYTYQGAGHYVGGHVMGSTPRDSVVDPDQRLWGSDNLWLVGAGNMVTEGTSNPTLTLAALTLRAADRIHEVMGR